MGGDVFVFPKTKDPAAQGSDALAKVMLEPGTQIAFNTKKGSIPVRTDVDVSSMDVCAQKGAELAARQDPAGAADGVADAADLGAVDDVITQLLEHAAHDGRRLRRQVRGVR